MSAETTELANLGSLFTGGEIVTQSPEELAQLNKLSNSSQYLQRIQLFGKGGAVDKDLIGKGHFGVPKAEDDILDLGDSIDLLVIARKAKALDTSVSPPVESTDPTSAEFQRIEDRAENVPNSRCMYGPTYLVYERSTNTFYEYFCGNKSSRIASTTINDYLPVSQAMIDAGMSDEEAPRGPKPMCLKSRFSENDKGTWFSPKAEDSLTPFKKLPTLDEIKEEVDKFLKKDTGPEAVAEDEVKVKRKR